MYYFVYILLLGISLAVHDIVSAQGLSENMEILNTTLPSRKQAVVPSQGPHKVSH